MANLKPLHLSSDDRATLRSWLNAGTTQQRLVLRAKIVLAASEGRSCPSVASEMGTTSLTVRKWWLRFQEGGIASLNDASRSGKPPIYDADMEKRILVQLDEPPPSRYATWNGALLAKALGKVSSRYVWRVLQRRGITLERRRSWCISTDPEFGPKAADIVGLYLAPPENAVVLCMDEKPGIQALERAQGWLRLPNGRAITGYNHEYKRHGTSNLFAALEVATGQVKGKHYARKRRREFLDFMNSIVAGYPPATEIHVVLDNYCTHKPKNDRWLAMHSNVHFHYTPTHASWLNQVEIWFSMLWRHALRGASFTSPKQLRAAIDRYIEAYSEWAHPFEWTKSEVQPVNLKSKYIDLCR